MTKEKEVLKRLLKLQIFLMFIWYYLETQIGFFNMPSNSWIPEYEFYEIRINILELLIGIPTFIIFLIALIGLFKFKAWAPKWYLVFQILYLLFLFIPKTTIKPTELIIISWIFLIVGFIVLYYLYCTPLKESFRKDNTESGKAESSIIPDGDGNENFSNQDMLKTISSESETKSTLKTQKIFAWASWLTDHLFPQTANARVRETPPEIKNKRRILIAMHYVWIILLIFLPVNVDILFIAALCFVIANLARLKDGSLEAFFVLLTAGFCLCAIVVALFFLVLTNFSKDALPLFIFNIAGWLLLFLIEVYTYKFIIKKNRIRSLPFSKS